MSEEIKGLGSLLLQSGYFCSQTRKEEVESLRLWQVGLDHFCI